MPSETIDQVLRPEIWGKLVNAYMKEYRTPMRSLLLDLSMGRQLALGTKVPLVYPDDVAVSDRGALGSAISYPIPKDSRSDFVVDQNKYASMLIPDEIKSTINDLYIQRSTRSIAEALANYLEQYLINQVKTNAKIELTLPALDATNIKQVFIQAKKAMNKLHIPASNRFLVMDDESFSLVEDWLTTTTAFNKSNQVLDTGNVYELYGMKISLSSFADGIYFGHGSGLVYGFALERFMSEHDMDLLSTKMAGQMVFGTHAGQEGAWLGKVVVETPPAPAQPEQAPTEKKKGFFNG